jgi:hypothetical protein
MPTVRSTVATSTYTLEDAEGDIAELRGLVDQLSESHALANATGDAPETTTQTQLYETSQNMPGTVLPTGFQGNLVMAQNVFTPGNTVTAASLTNLAQFTVPANDPAANALYEIEVWGNGIQGSTKQTLEFAVIANGNTMSSVNLGTAQFSATSVAFRFFAVARLVCLTSGSSGTFSSYIHCGTTDFNIGSGIAPTNGNTGTGFSCESTGTTTINTTGSFALGVSAAWGSTVGSPTLTSRVAMARRWA